MSKTTPSMQMAVQSPFRPQSSIHAQIFDSIRNLNTKYIRWVPWLANAKMAVAELKAPTAKTTSWDLRELDGVTVPFFQATENREPVVNFSVIPRWMFKTQFDVKVPDDPNELVWNYSNITGTPFAPGKFPVELTDPTGKQIGEYFGRLASWYSKGGFTDEVGQYHRSGHHYSLPWWEVLSELDNGYDVKLYNKLYDAIVTEVRKVSPATKFVGYSAMCFGASENCTPQAFEYFLDPKNHAPGIPIDRISYHTYAIPSKGETPDDWQHTLFQQADNFLNIVKFVDAIRERVRPKAGVEINEIGCILPEDGEDVMRGLQGKPPVPYDIPNIYWNACGAYFAYMYTGLAREGIDVAKASQVFGYPGQFTSVSLLNYKSGLPNARYRVLELIVNNFHPGDRLVRTDAGLGRGDLEAQAFITPSGKKLLLINKRNREVEFSVKSENVTEVAVVDSRSAGQPARVDTVRGGKISLAPFAVAVASIK